ncbi:MAG TPA: YIP1 family protein [Thermoanaerobaculia bacterium]|nr:YIP1 family protein [Thermoanaerobaculia bacterium]
MASAQTTAAETTARPALERNWWLRAPAVLVAPRAVFASLRDDSVEAIEARQEPLTAMIGLAGIGAVLGAPTFRHILNDGAVSPVLIPVLAFISGMFYAIAVYWVGGGLLFGAARRLGGLGSYHRARHLLALATAPLALTLFTLWPLRILIYGQNLFRTGGDDWGPGDRTFGGFLYFAFVWSAILLVVGVRSVHGWTWGRSLATVALAAALPVLIVVAYVS